MPMDIAKTTSLYQNQAGLSNSRAMQLGRDILNSRQATAGPTGSKDVPESNSALSFKDASGSLPSEGSTKPNASFLDVLKSTEKEPNQVAEFNKDSTGTIENQPTTEQEAVQQFVGEAFFGILMKQMRNSVWKSDLMGGSSAQKQFEGQLDQVLVQNLAASSSERISKPFYEQMQRNRGS